MLGEKSPNREQEGLLNGSNKIFHSMHMKWLEVMRIDGLMMWKVPLINGIMKF